jgi:hypothetical protein
MFIILRFSLHSTLLLGMLTEGKRKATTRALTWGQGVDRGILEERRENHTTSLTLALALGGNRCYNCHISQVHLYHTPWCCHREVKNRKVGLPLLRYPSAMHWLFRPLTVGRADLDATTLTDNPFVGKVGSHSPLWLIGALALKPAHSSWSWVFPFVSSPYSNDHSPSKQQQWPDSSGLH